MRPAESLRSVTDRSEVINRAKHGCGELIFFSFELASPGPLSFIKGRIPIVPALDNEIATCLASARNLDRW